MVDPKRNTLIIPLWIEIGEFKHSSIYISTLKDTQDSMRISIPYWAY